MKTVKLLKKSEAAKLLGVHPDTVGRLLRRGQLSGYSTGTFTRITVGSIEALLGESIDPGEIEGS